MKQMGCEHESRTIRALRTGEWSTALRRHVAGCADCSEALSLAQALKEEAVRSELNCNLPDPYWILERSRRLAREAAVRRMTIFLKVVRALAAVYAIAAAGWLARGYVAMQYHEAASALHGSSNHFALLGAMAALICAAAGLWPMLRGDGRRSHI